MIHLLLGMPVAEARLNFGLSETDQSKVVFLMVYILLCSLIDTADITHCLTWNHEEITTCVCMLPLTIASHVSDS